MQPIKLFTVIVALLLLESCANPTYKFTNNERTAKLKVLYENTVTICKQGAVYDLHKSPKQDYYAIPAEKRFDITSTSTSSGYQVMYYCMPKISFLPKEGKTYILDLSVIGEKCVLDLVQEDKTTKTGVSPDLTIGAPVCFAN